MKRGRLPQGFTIVEVLIFLAVSGALAVSAMFFIAGMQNKTQFNQAANDVLQQINTVINNVSNGYYAGNDNVDCTASSSGPVLTNTTKSRGTNKDCILLGRAIDFNANSFVIRDIVGLRERTSGGDVTSIAEAKPKEISATEQIVNYKNGLRYRPGISLKDAAGSPRASIGFFGTLAQVSASGDIETSAQQSDFIGFPGNIATSLSSFPTNYNTERNKQLVLCLDSGGAGGQRAIITIGGPDVASATTSMTIASGECS